MTHPTKKTLFDLAGGDRARIVRITHTTHPGLRSRLMDMGITKDAVLRVERHAPLGDPMQISIKGYHLALRLDEAKHIEVDCLDPDRDAAETR